MTDESRVLAISRPHPKLWTLYVVRSLLTGPGVVVVLPYLYFRYHTLRYRFDAEGVHMRWGILFRREVNLTYARIQDIHLRSGLLQRWLGLADILVQTASGSATAEMTIEGLLEYEAVRDFLYAKMRGAREHPGLATGSQAAAAELGAALAEVAGELRAARAALESLARQGGRGDA